jgi:hypothetical protein
MFKIELVNERATPIQTMHVCLLWKKALLTRKKYVRYPQW